MESLNTGKWIAQEQSTLEKLDDTQKSVPDLILFKQFAVQSLKPASQASKRRIIPLSSILLNSTANSKGLM